MTNANTTAAPASQMNAVEAFELAQSVEVGDEVFFRGEWGWTIEAKLTDSRLAGAGGGDYFSQYREAKEGELVRYFNVKTPRGALYRGIEAAAIGWHL